MGSFVSHTTVDCTDAYALSTWWKQVLADPEGNEFCVLRSETELAGL